MHEAATRIRAARLAAGLTIRAAAALYGCKHPWIAAVERGNRPVAAEVAHRFAEVYGVDPNHFLKADGMRTYETPEVVTTDRPLTIKDRIPPVVAAHPGITYEELAEAVGAREQRVRTCVSELRAEGKLAAVSVVGRVFPA